MTNKRGDSLAVTLIVTGTLIGVGAMARSWREFDANHLAVYLGAAVTLSSLILLRRSTQAGETVPAPSPEQLSDQIKQELQNQASLLEKREERLAQKLIAFQEWSEYPQPMDLATPNQDTSKLLAKDKQVLELLEAESRRVYEKISTNGYSNEGKFQPILLRDDIYDLVTRVARVYKPDSENPILETSAEQLLRATGRAALHLLVVVERLPLNVKEYDIASIYRYVRTGIKAVDVYKSVQPWLNYAKGAGYFSRFAMGASPMSLAAWWLLSEVGTRGAKKVVNHLVDYQAVALMHDFVRVIGYEVASIYGGDFRHRDPNWIYAAELTELLSQFPTSRDGLRNAMQEVGRLLLRNEYDRIYLYRCIANHQSAHPERYAAEQWLDDTERHAIAQQLEKFFRDHMHGKAADAIESWRQAVESRLHVRLDLKTSGPTLAHDTRTDAVRSLATYLLAVKEKEPPELVTSLASTALFGELTEEQKKTLLDELSVNPVYVFDPPDIEPEGELAGKYLFDLAVLAAHAPPYSEEADQAVKQAGSFLRRDDKVMSKMLKEAYRGELLRRFPAAPSSPKPPVPLARKALENLEPGEIPQVLYSDVTLEFADGHKSPQWGEIWLLGTDRRMMLLASLPTPEVIWKATAKEVSSERDSGYLVSDFRLRGGNWLIDQAPPTFRIAGSMTSRYASYFKPLTEYLLAEK